MEVMTKQQIESTLEEKRRLLQVIEDEVTDLMSDVELLEQILNHMSELEAEE